MIKARQITLPLDPLDRIIHCRKHKVSSIKDMNSTLLNNVQLNKGYTQYLQHQNKYPTDQAKIIEIWLNELRSGLY